MIKFHDNTNALLNDILTKSEQVKKILTQKYIDTSNVEPKDKKPERELRFLIVEDNLNDEFLMLRQLKKLKYFNIEVARHGLEALHYLYRGKSHYLSGDICEKPDMIFLDLQMPIMDGLEFLEKASESLRNNGIPVVIITSCIQEKNVIKCEELGAKAYLRKPINAHNLHKVISSVVNQ